MFKHVNQCLWALSVLWQVRTISRSNRLLLTIKSICLYLSFLAFTDLGRPRRQLDAAMVTAVITAVYDYETDWVRVGEPARSICFELLGRFVSSDRAQVIARGLFTLDHADALSTSGLERGGTALEFYRLVINSRWMAGFTEKEIDAFGRDLQIVDDLLDFKRDSLSGDRNCLLTEDREAYLDRASEFLESDFFTSLRNRSVVYQWLYHKVRWLISERRGQRLTLRDFAGACRPLTGAFAAVLTWVGYRLQGGSELLTAGVAASGFALVTASIMLWNDLVDRLHDVKKGKTLARDHTWRFAARWLCLSAVTGGFVLVSGYLNVWLGSLMGAIWMLGVLYSLVPHWYVLQNCIVALCAAGPVFGGAVYRGSLTYEHVLVFLVVFFAILMREIVKDIKDCTIDAGYKDTIAVRRGSSIAIFRAMQLMWLPVALVALYPHRIVMITSVLFGSIAFMLGLNIVRPLQCAGIRRTIDVFLAFFLAALLIA